MYMPVLMAEDKPEPRGTDQRQGMVVPMNAFHSSSVSSAVNGQQQCEEHLDLKQPTRPAGWIMEHGASSVAGQSRASSACGRHPGHLGCSVGEYLHPKWAEQRMRLYGAQEKLEDEAAIESQKRWGTHKQLVVFFGNAGIGPWGGVKGNVVTVDEMRTSRVSSARNSPQPCEEELDRSKPTRSEGWKPQPGQVQHRLLRSACSKRFEAPVRGLMWCPWLHQATPGDIGKWVDRDCNTALNLQRAGESKWRPLELCRWQHRGAAPAKGKEYSALGVKKLRDRAPKAQAQQPVAQ
ncbi:hypothetical protein QJQ45_010112 [Haematococcus lacustris]|nr:hypothetical protein QJQ45_010112 [Haematococcus lacustris]